MEKILQFGEGNFLRAFVEEYIEDSKEDIEVVICQPRTNNKIINALKEQNCSYDLILRGRCNGKIIDKRKHISCVSRVIDTVLETEELVKTFCSDNIEIIVSNTTEAGICYVESDKEKEFPNVSFPAKITYLLKKRLENNSKPLVFFPVELIENNGKALKECIIKYAKLWGYDKTFFDYLDNCSFCNTLVDRIVSGHNENDNDKCSVTAEPYRSLYIDCDERAKSLLPFSDETVFFVDDISIYRTRKVRILNGLHTMFVPFAFLKGFDIVRDVVNDEYFSDYINSGLKEIFSTINLPKDELEDFSLSVLERFSNPFIDHKLLDISLNSISKFRQRVLPSIIDYSKIYGASPKTLSKSLAYLIAFYNHKSNREYEVRDNEGVISFFDKTPSVKEILENTDFWGMDLTLIPNLENIVEEEYNLWQSQNSLE